MNEQRRYEKVLMNNLSCMPEEIKEEKEKY